MSPAPSYRERLAPSLWILVSAAVLAPMVALTVVQQYPTIALGLGLAVSLGAICLMVALAPVVEVRDGELRVGRAHIPVELLGQPVALTGEEARAARGRNLDPRSWHVIRGGIDGVVTVSVTDPDDPTPVWVVSSRTPDRLAAAVGAAQVTQRTPGR